MLFEIKQRIQQGKKILLLLLIIGVLIPYKINAQQTDKLAFSLKEAQDYAVKHNYDVRNSQLGIDAAKKKLKEITASGLPQINGSIDYQNMLKIPTMLIPNIFDQKFDEYIPVQFGRPHNANMSITATQLVFSGSYFVGLQTSKIYLLLSKQILQQAQVNVKEIVTNTFYTILVAEESKKILDSSLRNLEKTHYEITEMHKEGFVEETDVDQIQITVIKLKTSINSIVKNTEVLYKLLKFQMGIELEKDIILIEKLEGILNRVNIDLLIGSEFDLNNNVNYQLLTTQEKLSAMSLRNEKIKFFPTISAFASHSQNAIRGEFDFFKSSFNRKKDFYPSTIVGINIQIPIFSSGSRIFKIQQAKIALEQVKNTRLKASQGLLLEYSTAKTQLRSSYEEYLNEKETMLLAKKVYDSTTEKYREGISSSMDLTQAHNQYLTAQSNYIRAMSGLLTAKNGLDKVLNNY